MAEEIIQDVDLNNKLVGQTQFLESDEIDLKVAADIVVLGLLSQEKKIIIKSVTSVVTDTSGTSTGAVLQLKQGDDLIGDAMTLANDRDENSFVAETHGITDVIDLALGLKINNTATGDSAAAYKGKLLIEYMEVSY